MTELDELFDLPHLQLFWPWIGYNNSGDLTVDYYADGLAFGRGRGDNSVEWVDLKNAKTEVFVHYCGRDN